METGHTEHRTDFSRVALIFLVLWCMLLIFNILSFIKSPDYVGAGLIGWSFGMIWAMYVWYSGNKSYYRVSKLCKLVLEDYGKLGEKYIKSLELNKKTEEKR